MSQSSNENTNDGEKAPKPEPLKVDPVEYDYFEKGADTSGTETRDRARR